MPTAREEWDAYMGVPAGKRPSASRPAVSAVASGLYIIAFMILIGGVFTGLTEMSGFRSDNAAGWTIIASSFVTAVVVGAFGHLIGLVHKCWVALESIGERLPEAIEANEDTVPRN